MRETERVYIRPPASSDASGFLKLVEASRTLHRGWVSPPATPEAFATYVQQAHGTDRDSSFVCLASTGEIAGVANLSQIFYGAFKSAYLGFYAFAPSTGRGLMTAGLELVLRRAYRHLGLHRVEANVQPGNSRSRDLLIRLGFSQEGYSPRYLKVGGRWRDHERWALLADDWTLARRGG